MWLQNVQYFQVPDIFYGLVQTSEGESYLYLLFWVQHREERLDYGYVIATWVKQCEQLDTFVMYQFDNEIFYAFARRTKSQPIIFRNNGLYFQCRLSQVLFREPPYTFAQKATTQAEYCDDNRVWNCFFNSSLVVDTVMFSTFRRGKEVYTISKYRESIWPFSNQKYQNKNQISK